MVTVPVLSDSNLMKPLRPYIALFDSKPKTRQINFVSKILSFFSSFSFSLMIFSMYFYQKVLLFNVLRLVAFCLPGFQRSVFPPFSCTEESLLVRISSSISLQYMQYCLLPKAFK